jgi:hypothetical protein
MRRDYRNDFHSEAAMNEQVTQGPSHLSIPQLGWSLSIFFIITYALCIALGVIWPDWEMHRPWLQFFPGFEWLTVNGFFIGLIESFLYGWYVAVVFVPVYNFIAARK